MPTYDPRIDTFIEKQADFAKPILNHLRELVHKAVPGVEETLKWGMPSFMYNKKILCGMAAFKQHAVFGFWYAAHMKDPYKILQEDGMGSLGKITDRKQLPKDKILIEYLREAAAINESDIKRSPAKAKPVKRTELEIPPYLTRELRKNTAARKVFEAFSYSAKKDYVE